MDPRSEPEIKEAIALFDSYERAGASYTDARKFKVAVQILDDYLEENPGSPHLAFIQNLKLSYTRRLMQRIASVNKADLESSLEHIVLVAALVKDEAEKLMSQFPEHKRDWDRLIGEWAYVIAHALVNLEDEERKREHIDASHT